MEVLVGFALFAFVAIFVWAVMTMPLPTEAAMPEYRWTPPPKAQPEAPAPGAADRSKHDRSRHHRLAEDEGGRDRSRRRVMAAAALIGLSGPPGCSPASWRPSVFDVAYCRQDRIYSTRISLVWL
jgi:hypothetical protein